MVHRNWIVQYNDHYLKLVHSLVRIVELLVLHYIDYEGSFECVVTAAIAPENHVDDLDHGDDLGHGGSALVEFW